MSKPNFTAKDLALGTKHDLVFRGSLIFISCMDFCVTILTMSPEVILQDWAAEDLAPDQSSIFFCVLFCIFSHFDMTHTLGTKSKLERTGF